MQRTITTVGLLAVLLLAAAVPASAAPRNANNENFVIPVSCVDADGEDAGWTAVRPTPSPEGKPAWDIETGQLQVGLNFAASGTITATIVGSEEDPVSFDFEDGSDHGASRGNKNLITCTAELGGTFVIPDIDQVLADILNDDFGTDIFVAGQDVEIQEDVLLVVQAIVPGR